MLIKNSRHGNCQIKTVLLNGEQFYISANPKAIDAAFEMAKLQHPTAKVEVRKLILDERVSIHA